MSRAYKVLQLLEGVAEALPTLAQLKAHPMWSESDYRYFKEKGYDHNEIKALWDRDAKDGNAPLVHKKVPDFVGVISDPDFYKRGRH